MIWKDFSCVIVLCLAISVEGEELVAFVGETLTLRCTVTNSYQQFSWIKDGTMIARGTPDDVIFLSNRVDLRVPTTGTRELAIFDVSKYDEGTYICHVTLDNGTSMVSEDQVRVESRFESDTTSSATEVTTKGEEEGVISKLAEETVMVGDKLTLVCPFHIVSAKFNWQKDGVPIAYGPPNTINVGAGRISVNASNTGWLLLTIDPVRLEDAGTYRCVVDSLYGNPFQMSKKVRVLTEEEQVTTTRDIGITDWETTSLVHSSTSQTETVLNPSSNASSTSPKSSASRNHRCYGFLIGIILIHYLQILLL